MNLNFYSLITAIEAEIRAEYLPNAISWCDENFDHAWTKAIDRFDNALSEAIRLKNFQHASSEGQLYKNKVKEFLSKYREHRKIDELKGFIDAISFNEQLKLGDMS